MSYSTFTKPRVGMKRGGRRTTEWIIVRARLKRKFAALGITRCELSYSGCAFDNLLGFAHGRKRRHLEAGELESLVILACNNCHDVIERMASDEMLEVVEKTIAERDELLEAMERERITEEAWKEYCEGRASRSQYNY